MKKGYKFYIDIFGRLAPELCTMCWKELVKLDKKEKARIKRALKRG